MKFGCLFAVRDIQTARAFYEALFGLQVIEQSETCVGFECGLTLRQDFAQHTGVPAESMRHQAHTCEICFEVNHYNRFVRELKAREDITLFHDTKMQPWGQRIIRFYDPDGHLVEVGEALKTVVERFMTKGLTPDAIAQKMGIVPAEVYRLLEL